MEELTWEENLKACYEYEQARKARIQMVPCAYCQEPVPSKDEWTQVPSSDEVNVHLEDGRHFHTGCYQVYLIEREK